MSKSKQQLDHCPHCRRPLEIVAVKFRLSGASTVASCPNCAITSNEDYRAAKALYQRLFWSRLAEKMDSLNLRFKYVLAFLFGALITAAVLRHVIHVYGGLQREEIRAEALMAIPAVALVVFFFRRWRGR